MVESDIFERLDPLTMAMKPSSAGDTSPNGRSNISPMSGGSTKSNPRMSSNGASNLTMSLTRKPKALRRNRSKGTIAGFASSATDSAPPKGLASPRRNGEVRGFSGVSSDSGSGTVGGSDKEGNQPQHAGETSSAASSSGSVAPPPPRSSASARLALVCIQNAIYMGAKTRLGLCPPGRARRDLLAALQARKRRGLSDSTTNLGSSANAGGPASVHRPTLGRGSVLPDDSTGLNFDRVVGEVGLGEYDRAEEEFLFSAPEIIERETNSDGEEVLEEPSSGDEDDLDLVLDECDDAISSPLGGALPPGSGGENDGTTYTHREPLYTPVGTDQASVSQGGAVGVGSAASGKLPFNRRKVRWFDNITASDMGSARQYLRQEITNLKKRDGMILTKHLRKMQRRERRRILLERSRLSPSDGSGILQDSKSDDEETEEIALEMATLAAGASRLPSNMSPSLSSALVLESLSLSPRESLEGLAKCYDGIVSAGAALLDSEIEDPTIGSAATGEGTNSEEKPSRSDIMNALAPILITTLEHPSGDAILALSKLRSMCGTKRYQRRFVQRIAPRLIRPPNSAMWSLRHKNDMEPILAAVEMILDAAPDVFASGWYDRGQTLLADSQRAETLRSAAIQLKRLSSASYSDGLSISLNAAGSSFLGNRRSGSLMIGTIPTKDGGAGSKSNESLAEWEVLAVDRQIRKSITNLFTNDWSCVTLASVPPRDGDSSSGPRHRRGISSTKIKVSSAETIDMLSPSNAAVASAAIASLAAAAAASAPASLQPSPLSPRGPLKMPLPTSPHSSQITGTLTSPTIQPTPDALESVFGPSFATQDSIPAAVASASAETSQLPIGPPSPPKRSPRAMSSPKSDVGSEKEKDKVGISGTLTPPQTPTPKDTTSSLLVGTPPRSPPAPRPLSPTASRSNNTSGLPGSDIPTISPGRENVSTTPRGSGTALLSQPHSPAPLSPTLSIGNSSFVSTDSTSNRMSTISAGSGSSAAAAQQTAQTAYIRTLTSTAAERKRTVAACRALRAQISRFEEAFVQLHGRPPKGAAERAPLATTYAQYREWKRAIRADAACRIQALFRGARVRMLLLRRNSPRMTRLVLARAGRLGYGSDSFSSRGPSAEQDTVLRELSIPVDIGESEVGNSSDFAGQNHSSPSVSPGTPMQGRMMQQNTDEGSEVSNIGVEVVISPTSQGSGPPSSPPNLSPSWGSMARGGRGRAIGDDTISVPRHTDARQYPVGVSSPSENINEFSLADLQAKKRELKQQLKQYDMNFARQHGRMPVKAEKEPIRHLYENYNALKSRITVLEREGGQQQQKQTGSAPVPYRRPAVGSIGSISDISPGDESSGAPPSSRSKRREKKQSHVTSHSLPIEATPSATSTPSGAPPTDLAALKAEKGTLHHMLRSYEKDFFRMHNRQVSSFADIRPVANQYKRYKEIKKAIAALQQSSGE